MLFVCMWKKQRPPPPPPPARPINVPPPLPPGWLEYYTQGGRPYWYNTVTEQTTWDRPSQPATPPPPPPTTTSPIKPKKARKKIPGTTWLLVTTDDGTEFYYDKTTKTSKWEMPLELEEPIAHMKNEEKEQEEMKRKHDTIESVDVKRQKVAPEEQSTEMTEEDIEWQMANMDPEELAALGLDQEQEESEEKQEEDQEEEQVQLETKDEFNQDSLKHEQQESSSDKGEDQVSEEERVELFTQMLTEKDISPFASWEKELPKLITDPRYQLVQPHNKRKTLFNNYCRLLALEKKSNEKPKTSVEEEFKKLVEDIATNKMYWDDFRRKAKDDPRFKAIRESKLRETLFKDHIKTLSKKETNKDRYRQLLIEKIHGPMRWRDAKRLLEHDDRYHDIESKTLREDLFRDYLEELDK
ncbi:uncharacterized protein BX664DRAFT_360056 [Halteromyces radiatus]|uniref:uncharacterized protein n=1 Tax=Halteromyces radiatus TaxID=101107 RepID=UPI002220FBAD|nr:uncharacterized protein BX664DRAFT_360056 [Halteromyces radiatus]KAI8086534.1 hypothetical protein BX664DRAFT_360056 [Halteromyces radiatus]